MEYIDASMDTSQPNSQWSAPNCQTLHQTLNEFRLNSILCDVIIMDEMNNTTPAHSCILAAASPVLKSTIMLKDTNKMLIGQGITLMIAGISAEVWKLLLEYLYLNTLVIPAVPGLLENILVAANMLGMKDLTHLIKNHVETSGIALGPTKDVGSLKITLAPTRPVQQEHKAVQTGNEKIGEPSVLKPKVRVIEASQFKHDVVPAPDPTQYPVTTPVIVQALTTQQVPQEAIDNALAVSEAYAIGQVTQSLRCRFCRMEFDRKANLVEHVSDWCGNLNKPFLPSDIKPPKFELINQTMSPSFESQGDGKVYRCINPECGQFFKTSTSLRRHSFECILGADTTKPAEMIHDLPDGTIMYRDDADVNSLDEGAIEDPLAYLDEKYKNVGLKARVYNCAHCSFSSKRERMAVHLAVHHGKRRPFSCRVCGLRYGYYDSLRDHYVGVHTTAQFNCTVCGKVFKRSIMLRRHHLYEHTREGKALYPCKGCGKKFKHLAHARRHELYHNPTDSRRKHRCEDCQKLFCTRQDLERHVESVHSNLKPYKCQKCSYSTPRKFQLLQHEKKHGIVTGRFLCVTCDKCFVSETFFRAHLREKHPGSDIINSSENIQLMQLSSGDSQSMDHSQETTTVYTYA